MRYKIITFFNKNSGKSRLIYYLFVDLCRKFVANSRRKY
nr:MAG TPA: Ras-related protein Rab-6A-nucleotide complex, GTPase-fold, PROTEIN TRANSPORT [Caudoviricetes sp.]